MIICKPKAVTSGITVANQLIRDAHVGSNPAQVQMTKIAKPVREHSGPFETEHKSEVSNKTQE